jgi:hypothetical protein
MITTTNSYSVAVSSPGGVARQYRVQFRRQAAGDWQLHGSFRSRDQAEKCANQLQREGCESRVVAYALCPTGL